jgi:uncharacterized membrane protein YfcA
MTGLETIFTTATQCAATCAVLAFAQAVYVLFGFGAGLIAIGALGLVLPEIQDAVVLLLLINLPSEVLVVLSSWRSITWRGVLVMAASIAVGMPVGAWWLSISEPLLLLGLLGGVLLVAGAFFLVQPNGRTVRWPWWSSLPFGLVSGVLGGLFGTGGPPLILYYRLSGATKEVFRGNLMALFLMMTLYRVGLYSVLDLLTPTRTLSALATLPAVIAGVWIGHRLHIRIDEVTFRKLVGGALIVLGLVVLAGRL